MRLGTSGERPRARTEPPPFVGEPRFTLRDDGKSYGDYVELLTYQLFLKTADERSRPP